MTKHINRLHHIHTSHLYKDLLRHERWRYCPLHATQTTTKKVLFLYRKKCIKHANEASGLL